MHIPQDIFSRLPFPKEAPRRGEGFLKNNTMQNFKSDFPVFQTHPNLVYLDNTATTQKPAYVIDGVAEYLRTGYANIHR